MGLPLPGFVSRSLFAFDRHVAARSPAEKGQNCHPKDATERIQPQPPIISSPEPHIGRLPLGGQKPVSPVSYGIIQTYWLASRFHIDAG